MAIGWYAYLSYFVGGAFLSNAIPHLVNGISGRPFFTPFARPRGRGMSSPVANVLWAAFNVAVGYWLLFRVGDFHLQRLRDAAAVGVGALLAAAGLARVFEKRLSSSN